jgi:hypothetical protein
VTQHAPTADAVQHPVLHFSEVPTRRKRHMITETDALSEALDRLRRADPEHPVSLGELVVLGAERKVGMIEQAHADETRRVELRERFLRRTQTGDGVDWEALAEVHEHGWVHPAGD